MRDIYGTDPVKLMPAKCGEAVIVSPNTGPSAGTKLTTPAGTPASLIILKIVQFDSTAVSDGFQSTEFPWKMKYWKISELIDDENDISSIYQMTYH